MKQFKIINGKWIQPHAGGSESYSLFLKLSKISTIEMGYLPAGANKNGELVIDRYFIKLYVNERSDTSSYYDFYYSPSEKNFYLSDLRLLQDLLFQIA